MKIQQILRGKVEHIFEGRYIFKGIVILLTRDTFTESPFNLG